MNGMTSLHRKVVRDLWLLRGPALAIGLVIASGVATFVMSLGTLSMLYRAQSAYYERYRFADVFLHLQRAPQALLERLAVIPNVDRAESRIVQFVNLDLPWMSEPVTGRLQSLPDRGEPVLNALHLLRGRWPEPDRLQEVLVSDGFAAAQQIGPGDRVGAILNGRRQELRIVGVAMSPEFIYQIREGEILPDDKRFGIFWIRRRALEAAFQMEGAFNEAALKVAPGADVHEVIRRVDRLTGDYGGLGAYGRGDQVSHRFISNELNELRGMALVIPTIFLLVAAWLMQVVMSRLIGTQREQIAVLKAFGYGPYTIGLHFLELVVSITILGLVIGTGAGAWMGRGAAAMYARYFHFPALEFALDGRVVLGAVAIGLLSSVVAVLQPIWTSMRLSPAVAMRPAAPLMFGTTWIEGAAVFRRAPVEIRMILRQLLRQPLRASILCLGLSLAVAMLILGRFMLDGLNYVMESEFTVAQRQDLTLTFLQPTNGHVIQDVAHLPGVRHVEPLRAVPVQLRSGHRSRRVGLLGLPETGRLLRVASVHRQIQTLPPAGLILSEHLARSLAVRPGEQLVVEVLEGRRPIRLWRVAGIVADFQGEAAYASISAVQRLVQEEDAVTGALLTADPAEFDALYSELRRTPCISGASLKGAALKSLRETIVSNMLRMQAFNIGFACIMACGVVYNSARITLAERSRDLATLRVIGFTRAEVARILLGELVLLTVAAIPLGLGIGRLLAGFVIRIAYDTELFRIPLVISRATQATAALVTLLAALGTGLLVTRRVARLDLVAVLKTRE